MCRAGHTQEFHYIWFDGFLKFTSTWTIVYTTALWQSFTSSKRLKPVAAHVWFWFTERILAFRTFGSVLKAVVSQINRRRQTRTVKNFRRLRKHSAHIMSARHTTTADSERDSFCSLFFSFKSLFFQRLHNVPFFCLFPNPPFPSAPEAHTAASPRQASNIATGNGRRGSERAGREREGRRLTTCWSSAWWCRTLGWPQTGTPLRSHLERRRSRLWT